MILLEIFPESMKLPLWLTAIGVLGNIIVQIIKPLVPIFDGKKDNQLLLKQIDNLKRKLLICEEDTISNRERQKILETTVIQLEKNHEILISKIIMLKDLQESNTELQRILSILNGENE